MFIKNWTEYKVGFGDVFRDYWLGNDKIHRLTYGRNQTLLIMAEHVEQQGDPTMAIYRHFYISNEASLYTMHLSEMTAGNIRKSIRQWLSHLTGTTFHLGHLGGNKQFTENKN